MSGRSTNASFFYTLLGYLVILLILLVIALIIGAGLYWFVVIPGRFPSSDAFAKWSGLAMFTLGTFWWVIKESRPRWHNKAFWWTIVTVLFIHIAGFLVAFRYVEHWRTFHFFVICTIETPMIMTLLNWTFGKKHHSKDALAHS